jgi:hypothetical protein
MKKILGFILAAVLCLFLGPAVYAQHGGGHQGGGHQGGGGGGARGGERGGARGGEQHGGQARGGQGQRPQGHFEGDRGRHESNESRQHFDGRRFDNDFRGHYFGRDREFRIGRPVWYGGGFRFWYGGFWFGYDAWPYGWGYDDPVYIDCDGDFCYLYNPWHPGVRIIVNVY